MIEKFFVVFGILKVMCFMKYDIAKILRIINFNTNFIFYYLSKFRKNNL